MTNYTIIQNSLITNIKISDGAYRLYILLQSMCYGDKDSCYPSIAYLACALGRSCRTINRYLKELIKNNLIVKRRRGSISSIYTILSKVNKKAVEKVKEAVKAAKNAYNKHKSNNKNSTNNTNNYTKKESFFNNFDQRNYNFNKLEELLRGGEGELSDCLLE